jgi:hypothetical protein
MAHSRRIMAGVLLALVWGLDGAWAQGNASDAARVHLDERSFCEAVLDGDLWARTELYFGLSRAEGPDITEDDFQGFLDSVVTPRFPDGLTLLSGNGQFRGSSGVVVQEGTKLLILFYPWSAARNRAVERIRALYKSEFQQEAVLRVDEQSCVSF